MEQVKKKARTSVLAKLKKNKEEAARERTFSAGRKEMLPCLFRLSSFIKAVEIGICAESG